MSSDSLPSAPRKDKLKERMARIEKTFALTGNANLAAVVPRYQWIGGLGRFKHALLFFQGIVGSGLSRQKLVTVRHKFWICACAQFVQVQALAFALDRHAVRIESVDEQVRAVSQR